MVKPRLMFLGKSGIYETNRKLCAKNYVKQGDFRTDIISVIPFEVVYMFLGIQGWTTIFRINRVLRHYAFSRAFDRWDAATSVPTLATNGWWRCTSCKHFFFFSHTISNPWWWHWWRHRRRLMWWWFIKIYCGNFTS